VADHSDADPAATLAQRHAAEVAALHRITRSLVESSDLDSTVRMVLAELVSLTKAERGFLLLARAGSLEVAATHNAGAGERASESIVNMVLETGRSMLTLDAMADPRFKGSDSIVDQVVRSVLAAPLRVGTETFGAIYLDSRYVIHEFTEDDQNSLEVLAAQAALSLHVGLMTDQLRRANQDLERRVTERTRELEEVNRRLQAINVELDAARLRLEDETRHDGLTRLVNHRYFQEKLRDDLGHAVRRGGALSLLFLDVDNFKNYNDAHGHPRGDEVLRGVADTLRSNTRTYDTPARYGGEEFAVILPATPRAKALQVAERIRQAVATRPFHGAGQQPLGMLSVSIGLASYPENGGDPGELIAAADRALYQAKHTGKNRVVGA
jgi:diguanylate cyclase (GGDEF)-like protein